MKSCAGDWVEVLSKEEILGTLDKNGRLDKLPSSTAGANDEGAVRELALITGVTGQDGAYLAEYLLGWLHRARHQAPFVLVQHRAHRSSL